MGARRHLFRQDIPIDITTVADVLRKKGILDKVGEEPYLAELAECIGTSANVGHYCRILLEYVARRRLIDFNLLMQEQARNLETPTYELYVKHSTFAAELQDSIAEHGGLPPIEDSMCLSEDPPEMNAELIKGILRIGHKMSLNAPSKAGKSFALICLALCLAYGLEWLGFLCRKSRVLYINFEIDRASCINRFFKVAAALNILPRHENLKIWNLRGHNAPIEELIPKLTSYIGRNRFDVVIIDPFYKMFFSNHIKSFDENSAASLAYLFCKLDKVIKDCGCALIMAGHYSKGMQGGKSSIDRTSGSGVLGRDPDAILTLTELEKTENAYRLESVLREFPSTVNVSLRFEFPLHVIDTTLDSEALKGSVGRKQAVTGEEVLEAFEALDAGEGVTIAEMHNYLETGSLNTFKKRIKELDEKRLNRLGLHIKGNRIHSTINNAKGC